MSSHQQIPSAVTIAGSDSGGGAGIQADLKTFAALNIHGTSVLTCLTAQNPRRVIGIEPCSPFIVRQQLKAVFEELRPVAAKTGMLYSSEMIHLVASFLRRHPLALVVDPVMVATSGARLLKREAIAALCKELLPQAAVITPNLAEAELLTKMRLNSPEDLRHAARQLHQQFQCAALVKGGHLRGLKQAVDIFYDGKQELMLTAPFVKGLKTHGTGCTYSAAITAYLARGLSLPTAVCKAKQFITQAILNYQTTSGHPLLRQ
ncbi:MAG TPA: bifunctional hydroxymethylpyrimidine kinase/phosphomethylpyrimidine kinase [Candidatus Limnocylindrales bacterium]|jgi:hydroxymethylpyrimidine/phosphomethylpyrimidine kinase|nr:bifunctional hydroxymethylpyrimidine kinase/phosphomethylpyrimidine kinase [Candidatus Limnocylindrales bacterium]